MKFFLVCLLLFVNFQLMAVEDKKVLLAILARNKAHVLEKYLKCLDSLDYNKKLITVYINTNNNQDATKEVLENWVKEGRDQYEKIIFESHEVDGAASTRPHEWNADRFKLLGTIRNKSLQMTKENQCDYYFVVDCDNFIAPCTLKELMSKDKPIIAPMLLAVPELGDGYSNYFCAITETGYFQEHPDYGKILRRSMQGTYKVPVVHCTYLIDAKVIDKLTYVDNTHDYEFVIFSRSARDNNIDQYICNEKQFGVLLHFYKDLTLEEEIQKVKQM
jgi:Anp1